MSTKWQGAVYFTNSSVAAFRYIFLGYGDLRSLQEPELGLKSAYLSLEASVAHL